MTFYFYDLETTGFNSREGRIMQFAGQRTDMQLNKVGKPHNILIKLPGDVLPDPGAVLVTGITPQKTLKNGISESEFADIFINEITLPNTIFVGYNNIRFDDEFIRHALYRNFYDPYEWQWQDGRSRWDLLDVTRMTRALRPQGIKWPFDSSASPSNQLSLLTSINKLKHLNAHDALSDVEATIALARLILKIQPKLFKYLLKLRDKKEVARLVNTEVPFIYTSGKYDSQNEKTTVALPIYTNDDMQYAIVYDLRYDPEQFKKLSKTEILEAWKRRDPKDGPVLPVKTIKYNRCPAVAPLNTLDDESKLRLGIDIEIVKSNAGKLKRLNKLKTNIIDAKEKMDEAQQLKFASADIDNQLYDKFFNKQDKYSMSLVHKAKPTEIQTLLAKFSDIRLKNMLPLYKARNYHEYLDKEEKKSWQKYLESRLIVGGKNSRINLYFQQINELKKSKLNSNQNHLLKDLEHYGNKILASFS